MILFLQSETLWSILCSPAHWIAEIIVTIVFDGLLLGLFWPMLRNCYHAWQSNRPQKYDWSMNPIAARNGHLRRCPRCRDGVMTNFEGSGGQLCMSCGYVTLT